MKAVGIIIKILLIMALAAIIAGIALFSGLGYVYYLLVVFG